MGWHEMVSEGHIEKKQTRKKKKRKKRKKKRKKKLEAASGTQKAERRKRNKQKKKELRRDRRSTVIEVIGTHRTTGRSSPDTGRGATAAALACRASRRRFLRAGWLNQHLTRRCHCFLKWLFGTTLLFFTIAD